MALQIFVNGIERTSLIEWHTIELNENLTDEVDTLRFTYLKTASRSFIPGVLDEVTFFQGGVKIFGGNIVDINESVLQDSIMYSVTVKDYAHIMDRYLVVDSYTNQPAINIICDILNRYVNRNSRIGISDFEPDEIWDAGSADTTNYITGTQGRLLSNTNGVVSGATVATRFVSLNLQPTGYSASTDYIDIDFYIDNRLNLNSCVIRIGDSTMTNYYSFNLSSLVLVNGFNHAHILKSAFIISGSPSWSSVTGIQLSVTSTASTTVNVTFDNWNVLNKDAFTSTNAYKATQLVSYIPFNYTQPSAAFKKLAELFQWQWFVDENKDIHFFAQLTEPSPFNLTDTNGTYIFRSLILNKNADQLRNSIYVRGGEYLASAITDDLTHQVDGTNKIYKLAYKYANYTLNKTGVRQAVGLDNIDAYSGNVGDKQTNFGVADQSIGDIIARTKIAQQIITTAHGRRNSIKLRIKKVGSPVDNLQIQLFSDSGSNTPSATSISILATIAGSSLTTSYVETTISFTGNVLDPNAKYHVVISRSGAIDASNYYKIDTGNKGDYDGLSNSYNGSSWSANSNKFYFIELLSYEALYNYNEKIITFQTAPLVSDTVQIIAQPYLPVIVQYKDNTSISTYGEYQHKIIDQSIKSNEGARQRAQQDILEWAQSALEGSYTTLTPGLHAGQTQHIDSAIRGINDDYLIKSITARPRDPNNMEYSVSIVTTKTMSMLYWMQQQVLKDEQNIVISDDEVLSKIESIFDTINLSSSYSTRICAIRVWSNDAGTTTNRLIYDGTACDVLN